MNLNEITPAGTNWKRANNNDTEQVSMFYRAKDNNVYMYKGTTLYRLNSQTELFEQYSLYQGDMSSMCESSSGRLFMCDDYWPGRGIFYSDDNGISWQQSVISTGSYTVFCTSDDVIIAAAISSDKRPYYSIDNGNTWQQIDTLSYSSNGCAIDIYELSPGQLLFNQGGHKAMYSSNDSGKTWTKMSPTGISASDIDSICVTSTGKVLAACNYRKIYCSSDNGYTWVQIAEVFSASDNARACQLYRASNNTVFVIGYAFDSMVSPVLYSNDDGITWHATNLKGPAYYKNMCETPKGRLLMGTMTTQGIPNNTGLWYSDPAIELTQLSKPLTKAQVLALIAECKAYVQSKK